MIFIYVYALLDISYNTSTNKCLFKCAEFNDYLKAAEAKDPGMPKRISAEIAKYFRLFDSFDIDKLVDTSSLLQYISQLTKLAPSTIVDKLRYIQLAIEYLQFKYTDSEIKNIKRCERAMKWLKQWVKHYSKRIREQRASSHLRGEETVEFAKDPATVYESLEVKSKVHSILQEATQSHIENSDFNIVLAYISAVLMFRNAQKPNTIANMTVEEYSKRKEIEPGKYIIRVVVHKTASNGPVNLIYHNDMEECLFKYYTLLRPLVTPQTKKLSELFFLTPTGRRFNKITETIKKVANRITHVTLPISTMYRKVITTEALKDDESSEEQVRAVEDHMAHSIQTSRRFYNLPGTSKATDAHCTIEMISLFF